MVEDAAGNRSQEKSPGLLLGSAGKGRTVPEILIHLSTVPKNQRAGIPDPQRRQGRSKSPQDPTNTCQENQIRGTDNK